MLSYLFKVRDTQTCTDACTHDLTQHAEMPAVCTRTSVAVCVRARVYACLRACVHITCFKNINPAGTVFKCQTFNLSSLTLVGGRPCVHLPTATCKEKQCWGKQIDKKHIHINTYTHIFSPLQKNGAEQKYQHLIPLSAVEQIEVSCGERRESVPIQVANRR